MTGILGGTTPCSVAGFLTMCHGERRVRAAACVQASSWPGQDPFTGYWVVFAPETSVTDWIGIRQGIGLWHRPSLAAVQPCRSPCP